MLPAGLNQSQGENFLPWCLRRKFFTYKRRIHHRARRRVQKRRCQNVCKYVTRCSCLAPGTYFSLSRSYGTLYMYWFPQCIAQQQLICFLLQSSFRWCDHGRSEYDGVPRTLYFHFTWVPGTTVRRQHDRMHRCNIHTAVKTCSDSHYEGVRVEYKYITLHSRQIIYNACQLSSRNYRHQQLFNTG